MKLGLILLLLLVSPLCFAQSQEDLEFHDEIRKLYYEMQEQLKRNDALIRGAKPEEIFILKNQQKNSKPDSSNPSVPGSAPESQPNQPPVTGPAPKPSEPPSLLKPDRVI